MRTTRLPREAALIAVVCAVLLLGCGEEGATGPTGPEPTPPAQPTPKPDATAPSALLVSPAPGAELQGAVELRASARDNVGVSGVQFLVDDQPYGTELRGAPYRLTFDTRGVADGSHTLRVRARDAAGLTAVSPPVTVAVYNDPGIVELTIEAVGVLDDPDGFQLDLDGTPIRDIPGIGTFTVSDVPAGTHRLVLRGLPPFCGAREQIVKVRSTAPASAVLTIGCVDVANDWLLVGRSLGGSMRLSALSLESGAETVLVPELRGLGAVSPDGKRLAYTDDGTLLIGSLESFAPVAVAHLPGAREVRWSPDGSALVLSADRAHTRDLFIVNADGTDLHPMFETLASRLRPAWSATGRIAFEVAVPGPMEDLTTIWSADPDGGNVVQLTSGMWDEAPAWSPDGSRLAFTQWVFTSSFAEVQVAVVNADGTRDELVVGDHQLAHPVWSPDGMWVAHSSPGALKATHVSGTATTLLSGSEGRVLGWVAGVE